MRQLKTARGAALEQLLAQIQGAVKLPRFGGRAGANFIRWGRTAEEVEALRRELLDRDDIGRVQDALRRHNLHVDRGGLNAVKRYCFDSRGIAFMPDNYYAWTRLASGKGTVDDARYIVHEMAEIRELEVIRRDKGFDYMGSSWESMSARQRQRWQADYNRYYEKAHAKALESEYDFIADQVSVATNGRVRISRTVVAAVDPTRSEGRDFMQVGGVELHDHPEFHKWEQRRDEVVELGTEARRRLFPYSSGEGEITLAELVAVVKRSRLQGSQP